jgi:hypothetical protein
VRQLHWQICAKPSSVTALGFLTNDGNTTSGIYLRKHINRLNRKVKQVDQLKVYIGIIDILSMFAQELGIPGIRRHHGVSAHDPAVD